MRAQVLVVEDDMISQIIATAMMRDMGLGVKVASNGKEALAVLQEAEGEGEQIAFILMDCQMPVMDGFETTAAIRAREQRLGLHRTPILACSAYASLAQRAKCEVYGMDDVMHKPISQDVLESKIARWMSVAKQSTRKHRTLALASRSIIEQDLHVLTGGTMELANGSSDDDYIVDTSVTNSADGSLGGTLEYNASVQDNWLFSMEDWSEHAGRSELGTLPHLHMTLVPASGGGGVGEGGRRRRRRTTVSGKGGGIHFSV